MSTRGSLVITGIFGLSGVGLGALGSHALRALFAQNGLGHVWETAVLYQLVHTLALLAVLLTMDHRNPVSSAVLIWAVGCWIAGIILFSGSLYALALGGPAFLGPVTPLGGLALMFGWVFVIVAALRSGKSPTP